MAWVTPPVYEPGDAEADVAASLLGGGKTSRLYKTLVFDQDRPGRVGLSAVAPLRVGVLDHGDREAGAQRRRARGGHRARADALAADGPTAAELTAVKTTIQAGAIFGLEHPAGMADQLNTTTTTSAIRPTSTGTCSAMPTSTPSTSGASSPTRCPATGGWSSTPNPGRRCCRRTRRHHQTRPRPRPAPRRHLGGTVAQHRPRARRRPGDGAARSAALRAGQRPDRLPGRVARAADRRRVAGLRWGSAADPAGQPGLAGFTAAMLDEGT